MKDLDRAYAHKPNWKNVMRKTLALTFAGLLATIFYSAPAYAYLDPGTGSIILQLLLGGVAGGLVIFKLYWARLKSFFVRDPKPQDKSEDPEGS
jgi:dolichol kinase